MVVSQTVTYQRSSILALVLFINCCLFSNAFTIYKNANSTGIRRPVVLMHGIMSNADSMNELGDWIKEAFPDVYVKSVEIGNGFLDSFMMPMNKQVKQFCSHVFADEKLKNGFNIIGFSQGSLIVRGAIQRCSFPNVYNLITLSGAHGGIFGLPYLEFLPAQLREIVTKYAYTPLAQNLLSVTGYWRDPYHMKDYSTKSQFLADINNEGPQINEKYRENLLKINEFVMAYSDLDEIITPRQSGWFMGYGPNSLKIEMWNNSREFTQDLVGMQTLFQENRLHTYTSHTKHRDTTKAPNKEFFVKKKKNYKVI